jgi:hypothetical protein
MYTLFVDPSTLNIQEMDEVVVIAPTNHPQFGRRFLVNTVQESSFHPDDSRGFLSLALSRKPRAHKLA